MEYLKLGKIIDAFKLDGTMKILSSTSFSKKRYKKDNIIYLKNNINGEVKEYKVIEHRQNQNIDFVKVQGIESQEDALSKKGFIVLAPKDNSLLEKNEFYFVDLEKCNIFDNKGQKLAKVIKVEEFPAQICLRVISNEGKTSFIPFIDEFIKEIDIKNNKIIINYIDGLL